MKFVDDAEFWFDPANSVVQVRSASRIGRKDFGVNRARIEAIRQALDGSAGCSVCIWRRRGVFWRPAASTGHNPAPPRPAPRGQNARRCPPCPSLPGALAAAGRNTWRRASVQLVRGGAMVLVLNLAIATLLTVGGLGRFVSNLVVSMCIGLVCWLIIDGGRHVVAVLRDRWRVARGLPPGHPFGFPGWHWLLALCALGLVLGPILGNLMAAQLTGDHIPGMWPFSGSGTGMTWLLTLLASAIAVLTLSLLERLAMPAAEAEAARRAGRREPAEAAAVAARAAHAVQHPGQPAGADRRWTRRAPRPCSTT